MTESTITTGSDRTRWDYGIRWFVREVSAPEEEPLALEFVRDHHLRVVNGSIEDDYIQSLIRTARSRAERFTRRAIPPQTLAQVLSAFPSGEIVLDRPPLIEVVSVAYVDQSGETQTLDAADYQVSAPQGPNCRRGRIAPVSGGSWPSTDDGVIEAVTITYRAGYESSDSPAEMTVPDDILHGMLMVIGEMYKQRSESVIGMGVTLNPAVLRAKDLWMPYRVFA